MMLSSRKKSYYFRKKISQRRKKGATGSNKGKKFLKEFCCFCFRYFHWQLGMETKLNLLAAS